MKIEELLTNKAFSRRITRRALLIVTYTAALVYVLFNLREFRGILAGAMGVVSPFLLGIAVAYVLNVLVRLFEERVFAGLNRRNGKIWPRIRRGVCILLSFVAVIALLTGAVFFVVPEVGRSLKVLTTNAPNYVKQLTAGASALLSGLGIDPARLNAMQMDWSSVFSAVSGYTTNFLGSLFTATMSVASGVISVVMGLIFSIYMLAQKEKLIRTMKRLLYAFVPRRAAAVTIRTASLCNRIFSGFVTGQLLEALIIGALCYIGMSVLRLPYALLVSTVISLTAVIPILGAYLGAAFGGFILLLAEPVYCLWFVIFIILLQQFEGNVIYPRVVGTSIGLPGIWVLLAILVCGDLFGIVGILLGVPSFSVVYALLRTATRERLLSRGITEEDVSGPA